MESSPKTAMMGTQVKLSGSLLWRQEHPCKRWRIVTGTKHNNMHETQCVTMRLTKLKNHVFVDTDICVQFVPRSELHRFAHSKKRAKSISLNVRFETEGQQTDLCPTKAFFEEFCACCVPSARHKDPTSFRGCSHQTKPDHNGEQSNEICVQKAKMHS